MLINLLVYSTLIGLRMLLPLIQHQSNKIVQSKTVTLSKIISFQTEFYTPKLRVFYTTSSHTWSYFSHLNWKNQTFSRQRLTSVNHYILKYQ